MILEYAHLTVAAEHVAAFEEAVPAIREHTLAAPGCREVSVHRGADRTGSYLIRVVWERLADHLEVYPTTPQARAIAAIIRPLLAAPTSVVHFENTPI